MTERTGIIDWAQSVPQPAAPAPLLVADLLSDGATLAGLLRQALRDQQWLDAFLLAAGLGQLIEDRLHRDRLMLQRAASYLQDRPSRPARLAGATAGAGAAVLRFGTAPARRRLVRALDALTPLIAALADRVLGHGQPRDLTAALPAVAAASAALGGDRVRSPACFQSFDQYPEDIRWLAREFCRQCSPGGLPPGAPLCVVGVRTSGCYLAPLHAAALRAEGASAVRVLTYRPGRPFRRRERSALRAVAKAGGLVLVTDDPPASGATLVATAEAIAAAGVPDERIVFVLSVFTDDVELPARLARWPAVVQPRSEWSVRGRLTAHSVRQALADLAGPDIEVGAVQPIGPPEPEGLRGHARGLFAVQMLDYRTGEITSRQIVVEGAGLGYLGRQSIAVARALPGQVPHLYGFAEGLLYRDWLPPGPAGLPDDELAGIIAGYVAARQAALPVAAAAIDRLGGRDPVWEVTARLLSAQYGRASMPARPLLLERLMRRMLVHGYPTVIDGKTDHRHWLTDPDAGGVRKVDFYQRGFGRLGLACYDPVFDLAGAAADPPAPGFEARLRGAYQHISGQLVDGERWLAYRLAQLWGLCRAGDLDADHAGQRSAAVIHEYLAGLYLRGLPPATGALVAIDLDGVLESDALGYPATSPSGVLALRALIAHGYRPVLATGRSLSEVRDRCMVFGLAGGVAEYGSVIVSGSDTVDLLSPAGRELLEALREELSCLPGVQLDPRYRHAVRARATGGGPLPAELLAGLARAAAPGVRVVSGQGQTDFTWAETDKGAGLRALAARLSQPGCALAVGDSAPDLPLFEHAVLARAPRNARLGDAGAGVRRTKHAYQAGLLDACADLLGHRPGGCPVCRPPAFAPRTGAMLALLDLRSNGMASVPGRSIVAVRWLIRKKGD
jgi:hydroxymethylpyrimidine pyrophosphatase-like HAD family hydrolase